jgi:molecular chaperone GrpE (heat shock protein)
MSETMKDIEKELAEIEAKRKSVVARYLEKKNAVRSEKVATLEAKIQKQKDYLKRLTKELRQMKGSGSAKGNKSDRRNAIVTLLTGHILSPTAIIEGLEAQGHNVSRGTVVSDIKAMVEEGTLEKVSRGEYTAS